MQDLILTQSSKAKIVEFVLEASFTFHNGGRTVSGTVEEIEKDRLFTIEQMSGCLRTKPSKTTGYCYSCWGLISGYKFGKRVLLRKSDVDRFPESFKTKSSPASIAGDTDVVLGKYDTGRKRLLKAA